jgi:hypothetical protein
MVQNCIIACLLVCTAKDNFMVPRSIGMLALLGLSLCVFSAGCDSGGPQLGTVTGKITLDDKPMFGVVVTFVPEGGSASYGVTDKNGVYTLMFTDTKAGAMVGSHKVTLESPRLSREEIAEMKAEGQEAPPEISAVPRKYSGDAALTAEVKKGKNTIDFPLTSK